MALSLQSECSHTQYVGVKFCWLSVKIWYHRWLGAISGLCLSISYIQQKTI